MEAKIEFVKNNRKDLYERLEYELSVLNNIVYSDYYLIIFKNFFEKILFV